MIATSIPSLYSISDEGQRPPAAVQQYGCRTNKISVDELFEKYQQLGFLYPEKMERLQPYWNAIHENWSRVMQAGDDLIRVFTFDDIESAAWASVVDWRTTQTGWCSQHLVSAGKPFASRAVMLAAQTSALNIDSHGSEQNWFRPNNKMPKRIFGSIEDSLGTQNASVTCYNYFEVQPAKISVSRHGTKIIRCDDESRKLIADFARRVKGDVYVQAENLYFADFELKAIDAQYRKVGLRRYRQAWMAMNAKDEIVAAIIAYRGPLGMNFSFLENRADLLIHPDLDEDNAQSIVEDLIAEVSRDYTDFEPGFIPMVACDTGATVLNRRGDECVRQYCQSIWLRPGYPAWFDHTSSFYDRIMQRLERRRQRAA